MFPKLRFLLFAIFTCLIGMTVLAGTNPFLASADAVVSCTNDGSQLATFKLCNPGDTGLVQVNDPTVQSVTWQLLDNSSCAAMGDDCPNTNVTCAWNTISTTNSVLIDTSGEYRVLLTYSSAPDEIFYANSFQKSYGYYIQIRKDISAFGANDAIIEISEDDIGVYEYQLTNDGGLSYGPYQNSPVFENLGPGSYQIKSRVISGVCEYLSNLITFGEPQPMVGQLIAAQAASCTVGGAIEVNVSGGVPPYQYSLNGGPYVSSNVFTDLDIAAYRVDVIDANGDTTRTNSVIITEADPILVKHTSQDVTCNGLNDGLILVEPIGGTGSYQYQISSNGVPNPYQNSDVFEGLAPGTYDVSVQDSGGCVSDPFTIIISEAPPLEIEYTSTSPSDVNSADGSISVNALGGSGGYEYAISPNLNEFYTSNVFTELDEGNYTIMVVDQSVCFTTIEVVLTASESISANVRTSYDCNGVDLPKVDFELTKGSGNLQYSIYEGIWQSSTTFIDVPDGTYTARAKNDDTQFETPITVANVVPVNVRVLEQNEGRVKFEILSGTAPFNYRVDSYSSPKISVGDERIFEVDEFSPGPHWLIVEGANCSDHASFDIEGFIPELEIGTEVTHISCSGASDASISVVGLGGLGEYNYGLVDGENTIIYPVRPETSDFERLAPGTYRAVLRDTKLGRSVRSELITITEPEALNVTLRSTSASQANANNGAVELAVTGGTAPYEYALNASNTFQALSNEHIGDLSGGVYSIQIRDAHGCISMKEVVIEEKVDKKNRNIDVFQNAGHTEVIDIVFKDTPNSQTTLAVYNSRGNMMLSSQIEQGTSQTQIDVNHLSRGIYFIYLKNGEFEEVKKVMIY